jgi:hypothetical protein
MSADANAYSSASEQLEAARSRRSSLRIRGAIVLFALLCVTVLGSFAYWWATSAGAGDIVLADGPETRPAVVASDGFIGSQACGECHQRQHSSWHASYHRTMTQVASPESILGDFDGTRLELDNREYLLGRDGDEFWVEIEAPSFLSSETPRIRRSILLCTGSHNMQVYWFSSGNGRELAKLPFAWVIDRGRWIPNGMDAVTPPTKGPRPGVFGFEKFDLGRWNRSCVLCHATHGKPRTTISPPDTNVAEFGISCEACHGPAQSHVDYHQGVAGAIADPLANPAHLDKHRSVEVCGRCHGFWRPKGARGDWEGDDWEKYDREGMEYRPGDDFLACGALLESIDESWHWPDGMPRVLAREYHGVVDSQCHQKGELTCLSCHAMHQQEDDPPHVKQWADDQLGVGMGGNRACVQCHEQYSDPDALTAHTHHPASSQGSVCYNCHMPNTGYSLLKASRSHAITNPTVEETLNVGRPNACNLCHLDKSLRWTGTHLADWYGQASPDLTDPTTEIADSVRLTLQGDAAQRAIIAWHFGWQPAREAAGDAWMAPYLAYLLADDYAAVREVAHHSLIQHAGYESFEQEKYELRAPADERRRKRDRVIARWMVDQHRPRAANPSLLLLPGGKLDTARIDELLRHRNNRPVDVSE